MIDTLTNDRALAQRHRLNNCPLVIRDGTYSDTLDNRAFIALWNLFFNRHVVVTSYDSTWDIEYHRDTRPLARYALKRLRAGWYIK